jgi:hypothetical protein
VESKSKYTVQVSTELTKSGLPGQNIGKILRQAVQQVSMSERIDVTLAHRTGIAELYKGMNELKAHNGTGGTKLLCVGEEMLLCIASSEMVKCN